MKKFTKLLCAVLCLAMFVGAALAETKLVVDVDYAMEDATNHTKIETTWERPVLEDGELGSGKPVGEPKETLEAHNFVDGKCTLCDYVLKENAEPVDDGKSESGSKDSSGTSSGTGTSSGAGTATATTVDAETGEETEATKEPVIRVIDNSETVHGVSVDQKTDIAQTMKTVSENLEADVQVKVADIENVLTADEATALSKLSAKEQLLVLLSALGFESEEPLSAEAQALLDSIKSHITAEELLKAFPTETVKIDGVDVECYVLTLVYTSANGEVLEHYAFRKDDNTFARLTVEE